MPSRWDAPEGWTITTRSGIVLEATAGEPLRAVLPSGDVLTMRDGEHAGQLRQRAEAALRRRRAADWSELFALARAWKRRFGENLGVGFEIGPADVPLIRQCLDQGSTQPLEDHIRRLLSDGRVY